MDETFTLRRFLNLRFLKLKRARAARELQRGLLSLAPHLRAATKIHASNTMQGDAWVFPRLSRTWKPRRARFSILWRNFSDFRGIIGPGVCPRGGAGAHARTGPTGLYPRPSKAIVLRDQSAERAALPRQFIGADAQWPSSALLRLATARMHPDYPSAFGS